ncbi:protein of unknown function [Pseudonocardia thermophila]|jgi:Domain of unknown function (DUF1876).|uniref:DUF1876 domain-containing protein n=1 Tax=Pseudonocardia thermophila TaxID=1848 RepID=A0A1M6XMQ7_PSETH|nr:DUF1876 domain-containing protein [Pseudonocardia thermophila]SHL07254.1 protein of unknown function [Pseudonocardia thermophila]
METQRWTVTIDIDEQAGRTHATARLQTRDTDRLVGVGEARLNPADRDVPEIGAELAAGRALSALAHQLNDVAWRDVEDAVRKLRAESGPTAG